MPLSMVAACSTGSWSFYRECRVAPGCEFELDVRASPSKRSPDGLPEYCTDPDVHVASPGKGPPPEILQSCEPTSPPPSARVDSPQDPRPCEWCGSCDDCGCEHALREWVAQQTDYELIASPAASAMATVEINADIEGGHGASGMKSPTTTQRPPATCMAACEEAAPPSRADWWDVPNVAALPALRTYTLVSHLTEMRAVRHAPAEQLKAGEEPWGPRNSVGLYKQMGMQHLDRTYIASWLNMGEASLLCLSEVRDLALFERCVDAEDFLSQRLKLIPGVLKAKLPFPSPPPEMAEAVGTFFGSPNVSCCWYESPGVVPRHVSVRIDLYSKWYIRIGMQTAFFRLGNEVELLLVDTTGRAVIAGFRLAVTQDFLQLVN